MVKLSYRRMDVIRPLCVPVPRQVVKAHTAFPEQVQWEEDAPPCGLLGVHKKIRHPGEVNRIRELPTADHIVATHTDGPDVLIWNTETQVERGVRVARGRLRRQGVLTGWGWVGWVGMGSLTGREGSKEKMIRCRHW